MGQAVPGKVYQNVGRVIGRSVVGNSTCVESLYIPCHSQSVCVLCSLWVIQHSLISFSDSGGVSGPSDSGSRSSSGDTGEGERRTGSMIQCQCNIPRYPNIPYAENIQDTVSK